MSSEEKLLLKNCREKIEQSLNWGNSANWSNQDFEDLSDKIFDETQVRLSITTLKRIWEKVRYDNSFNTATLNALARFAGFESWRTFRQEKSVREKPVVNEMTALNSPFYLKRSLVKKIAFAGIAFLLIAIFFFTPKEKVQVKKKTLNAKATFQSEKTSDDLPNSVIFKYDVSDFNIDSVVIQQNWDPKRREKVSSKNKEHTSIYYYPGNFNARLIINNEVVKTHRIFIKTKGWKGIIENEPIPIYLHPKEIKRGGAMGLSTETLKDKINTSVFSNRWVNFYNIREFEGLKSNNFVFEAEVRNTSMVEEALCRKVKISLLFDGGAIIIPLSDRGCVSDLELLTGSEYLSGKTHDLSNFGCDFNKFQNLRCEVGKNKLSIFLNEELIFFSRVNHASEMVGVFFSFEGTGEVRRVKLGEPAKFPIYAEQF
ncbi:MAG TPA: hypothetical protein VD908_06210 [Cytophagales bacterium]|nr:hypothetical protein [Cytophagales bacterium]